MGTKKKTSPHGLRTESKSNELIPPEHIENKRERPGIRRNILKMGEIALWQVLNDKNKLLHLWEIVDGAKNGKIRSLCDFDKSASESARVLFFIRYHIFESALEKAKEKKDTLFLNTARSFFGDRLPSRNRPGRKPSEEGLKAKAEEFREFLRGQCSSAGEHFYDRKRPAYLCWLASVIDEVIFLRENEQKKQVEVEFQILKLLLKVEKLIDENSIQISEERIFWPILETLRKPTFTLADLFSEPFPRAAK